MSVTVHMAGFRELEETLKRDFSKATARNILKRAAIEALTPMADEMRALAPERQNGGGQLKAAIIISDKLSPRQAKLHRRELRRSGEDSFVEMHAGVESPNGEHLPSSTQQEFGNENHAPQPFVRPAWDREKMATLHRLKAAIQAEIAKATARAARRAARASARAASVP